MSTESCSLGAVLKPQPWPGPECASAEGTTAESADHAVAVCCVGDEQPGREAAACMREAMQAQQTPTLITSRGLTMQAATRAAPAAAVARPCRVRVDSSSVPIENGC